MESSRQQGMMAEAREGQAGLVRRLGAVMRVMNLLPLILVFLYCRSTIVQGAAEERDVVLAARSWALAEAVERDISSRLASLRLLGLMDIQEREGLQALFQGLGARQEGFLGLGLLDSGGGILSTAGVFPYDPESAIPDWLREVKLRGESVGILETSDGQDLLAVAVTTDHGLEQARVLVAAVEAGSAGLDPSRQFQVESFLVAGGSPLATERWSAERFQFPGAGLSGFTDESGPDGDGWRFGYTRLARYPVAAVAASPDSSLGDEQAGRLRMLFLVGGGSGLIVAAASLWLAYGLATRLRESEKKRELAFREMEHTQKLSSIGRLAAGVAHEINNPLAIINEKAGLMKDLMKTASDFPRAERFVQLSDSILQSVARCRAITHRLLGFARRMEVQAVQLDLSEVIREVLGFLEGEAMYRQVKLDLDLEENLPPIETDRGQMQQVFLNLLNNALAAVEDGGWIKVSSWQPDADHVAARVSDNGHGMSRETMKHIFEPFFSTKGNKGSGLGLSITYGIVTNLGGKIDVESEPGKGTTFTITLPRTVRPGR